MTIKHFLKDKRGLFSLWLLMTSITCLVLWLTPNVQLNWNAVGYLVLLQSLALITYLTISYRKKNKWLKALASMEKNSDFFSESLNDAITEEQRITQDYFNLLLAEKQDTLSQLIQNQQDQKEFIDSWVHEIKVPLASIKLLSDTLEDDLSEAHYYQLQDNLQKIESYVEQVLYYARLDSFSRDYLIQEISLKRIIQPLLRQHANYFIQKNIRYEFVGEDQDVLTDQKWLGFIINQILSNSLKYTPNNGAITFKLSKNDLGQWLEITDTGIGIPLADQRRIFDKGFTGETGRNQTHHSTGLGLYLAKSLSEKLNHMIYVSSVEGEGTTISILFPTLSYYTNGQEEKLI